MSSDSPKFPANSPEEPTKSSETKDVPLLQVFSSLPHKRLFDEQNASAEEWSDPTAWRREEERGTWVSIRVTSQYGEYVRPLEGGRPYYRPSAEGKRLVEDVRNRLADAGFDVSNPHSSANLYADDFGMNLGRGVSPAEALLKAYDGEWCGTGTPEFRAMWPDQWPKDRQKPKQWDFEDLFGIKR